MKWKEHGGLIRMSWMLSRRRLLRYLQLKTTLL